MSKDKINFSDSELISETSFQTSLFDLSNFRKKKVEVEFTTEKISGDGGLLFLKEVEKNIGLIDRMVNSLEDGRHQSYVKHDLKSLLTQRIMQITAGYEDANDCDKLRDDGVLKVCCDKEESLAAQPTMSRFENSVPNRELYKIAVAFVDQFIAGYAEPPKVIILDCDDTDSMVYGG